MSGWGSAGWGITGWVMKGVLMKDRSALGCANEQSETQVTEKLYY